MTTKRSAHEAVSDYSAALSVVGWKIALTVQFLEKEPTLHTS